MTRTLCIQRVTNNINYHIQKLEKEKGSFNLRCYLGTLSYDPNCTFVTYNNIEEFYTKLVSFDNSKDLKLNKNSEWVINTLLEYERGDRTDITYNCEDINLHHTRYSNPLSIIYNGDIPKFTSSIEIANSSKSGFLLTLELSNEITDIQSLKKVHNVSIKATRKYIYDDKITFFFVCEWNGSSVNESIRRMLTCEPRYVIYSELCGNSNISTYDLMDLLLKSAWLYHPGIDFLSEPPMLSICKIENDI